MQTLPSLPCARCGKALHAAFVGRICPRCLVASVVRNDHNEEEPLVERVVAETPSMEQLHVGSRLGDYQLVDILGRGGMAVVYLARQISLDRLVALKMISAPKATDRQTQERFRRESRAVAQLDHPGIVSVHEAGTLDGALYFTMDYVDGPDLGRVMRERRLSVREAAELVRQIADAVGYAHSRGIVHRDLKPANVLLGSEGEPRVTDFGLALEGGDSASDITLTGDLLGTPPFMAPEILSGGAARATPPADVYSLGAMLFQMLTGRTPFIGESASEILQLALHEQPPSIRLLNPAVPRDLQTICTKCLEKAPGNRYANATELGDDLGRFLASEAIDAQPVSAPVRLLRWSRRRPAQAALIVALALGAIGATGAALAINSARHRAVHAEADAREQLWHANISHAQAARRTKRAGARAEALQAVADAARFRPSAELRTEAIAALALEDAVVQRSWEVPLDWEAALAFEPSLATYVMEPSPGFLVRRSCQDDHEISRLEVAGKKILGVPVFSADGKYLAARYADKVVRVWDVNAAQIAFELPERPSPMAPNVATYGFDIAFRPNGSQIAVGDAKGGFSLHAIPAGQEQARWVAQTAPSIVRFSPDGARIAVAASGLKEVHLLDAITLSEQHVIKLTAAPICAAWSPSSEQVAVGTREARVHFVEAERGEVIDTIVAFDSGGIAQLLFHPHRPILLSSSGTDENVHFWDTATKALLFALHGVNSRPVSTFNAAGTQFGSYDAVTHRCSLVDVQPSSIYHSVPPSRATRSAISTGALGVSPDGRWLVSSAHGGVQLRDAHTGEAVHTFPGAGPQDMMTAQFAPDGRSLFVGSTATGLRRVDIVTAEGESPTFGAVTILDSDPDYAINGVATDGRLLLVSEEGETAKLLDPSRPGAAVRWPVAKITAACFSADERQVLTEAGADVPGEAAVKVWDVIASGAPQLTASFGDDAGGRIQCSRDGGWVLVTGDKKTELWHYGSWTRGAPLPADLQGETHHAQLAPDGATLVIEKNHDLHLLSTATGESLATFTAPTNTTAIAVNEIFSSAGDRISLLWQYGTIQVWDVAATQRELATSRLNWRATP